MEVGGLQEAVFHCCISLRCEVESAANFEAVCLSITATEQAVTSST